MRRFSVAKQFEINPQKSGRVTMVMRMFGVSIDRLKDQRTTHACTVEVNDGDIVYITGPSGAGKSVLLREMQTAVADDERVNIDEIELPADRAAIDCVGLDRETVNGCGCAARIVGRQTSTVTDTERSDEPVSETSRVTDRQITQPAAKMGTIEAMSLLSYAGLSDVFCMLNAPANLSEGQKYRFRLACALASGRKFIFADEFCSNLDRITAAVIAYNVRRFAKRNNVTFFLASSHEDILADLQPDVLVVKHFTGPAEVTYKKIPNHK